MLGALRRIWAPEAFVVSFKLETDENILLQKVILLQFDASYNSNAVVANLKATPSIPCYSSIPLGRCMKFEPHALARCIFGIVIHLQSDGVKDGVVCQI